MAFNEDSSASGHDEPWIQWFCGLKGHEMFCEVERSYIEDGFNLYGLRACVSNFSDCLDLILDRIGPDDSDDSHLTQSACTLYGLIHARYIITAHGLDAMYNKYAAKDFGTCPLVQCGGQPVLPVGLKDEMGADTVKIFCPKCNQVYHPPPVRSRAGNASGVDGAAFGTTFPHLFLMTFSNLVPDPLPAESAYVPRVFGFRVHKTARQRTSSQPTHTAAATQQQPQQRQQKQRQQQQQQPQQQQQQQQAAQPPPAPAPAPVAAVITTTAVQPAVAAPAAATSAPAPAAAAANASANNKGKGATKEEGASNKPPIPDGEPQKEGDAAVVEADKQLSRQQQQQQQEGNNNSNNNKRKKDSTETTSNITETTSSIKKAEGNGTAPPLRMEQNNVKRRRRNNGST